MAPTRKKKKSRKTKPRKTDEERRDHDVRVPMNQHELTQLDELMEIFEEENRARMLRDLVRQAYKKHRKET